MFKQKGWSGLDCSCSPCVDLPISPPFSYTGRVELPDNLKSYFRPVAMMVPDTNMIAEVSLFVNGFTTASVLALKLSRFYEMIKSQISQQVSVPVSSSSLRLPLPAHLFPLPVALCITGLYSEDNCKVHFLLVSSLSLLSFTIPFILPRGFINLLGIN